MGDLRLSYRSRSRASSHWENTDGTPQKGDPGQVTPKGSPVRMGDHKWETTAPASDFGARQALTGRPQIGDDTRVISDRRSVTNETYVALLALLELHVSLHWKMAPLVLL